MSKFKKFNIPTYQDLEKQVAELDVDIQLSRDLSPLAKPVTVNGKQTPNAIAILPMEGCDSNPDGSPSELVLRRYKRLARGGAGLIWVEACAIIERGKANPLQMHLNEKNIGAFADMLDMIRREAADSMGADHRPLTILQMTHSGRYSKPQGVPAPVIGYHDPYLDERAGVKPDQTPITDEMLEALQDDYVRVALLAKEAGFDGVDIKSCHRYLLSELLAGFTRENSKYGGSFENRTRFLLETTAKVKAAVGDDFILACRLNVFDAHPYPYGWGVSQQSLMVPDMDEPIKLIKLLRKAGINLLSNSAGNPYYDNPFVTRPLDTPDIGIPQPIEHPLESTARLFDLTRQVQTEEPDIVVIGNGYSWLRRYSCYAGAANVGSGNAGMMGYGRMAFAYPDAPKDILVHGQLYKEKECIACSKCTQIMRDGGTTGCVIRDSEVYLPLYTKFREQAQARGKKQTGL